MKSSDNHPGSHISNRRTLPRRSFLRGAGVLFSLPLLEAMIPVFGADLELSKP